MIEPSFLVPLSAIVGLAAASRPGIPQWKPAAQTAVFELHDRAHLQISPRPTDSPIVHAGDLRRRQSGSIGSNTCGFLTFDKSPFSCDAGYTCTNVGQFRGCCQGSACKTRSFSSVCLDSTAPACSRYTSGTMCCTASEHPFCVTYLWATTATPNQVFSLYVCDTEYYAGQQILAAEQSLATTTTSPTSTSIGSSTSSVPTSTAPTVSNTPVADPGAGGVAPSSGAIAGIVIGGLAVIGLVVLGVFFMFFRHRKPKEGVAPRDSFTTWGSPGGQNPSQAAIAYGPLAPPSPDPAFHQCQQQQQSPLLGYPGPNAASTHGIVMPYPDPTKPAPGGVTPDDKRISEMPTRNPVAELPT